MGWSLPGSSVYGILQARILEWVAIFFCRGSSQPRNRTWVSHIPSRFFTVWATKEACVQVIIEKSDQLSLRLLCDLESRLQICCTYLSLFKVKDTNTINSSPKWPGYLCLLRERERDRERETGKLFKHQAIHAETYSKIHWGVKTVSVQYSPLSLHMMAPDRPTYHLSEQLWYWRFLSPLLSQFAHLPEKLKKNCPTHKLILTFNQHVPSSCILSLVKSNYFGLAFKTA